MIGLDPGQFAKRFPWSRPLGPGWDILYDYRTLYIRKGIAQAQLSQWDAAAATFAQAITLATERVGVWYQHALLRLKVNDPAGYRWACGRLRRSFGRLEDPDPARLMAWTFVLGADAVIEGDKCVQVVEKASVGPKPYLHLNTLGATLYRAGKFEAAIRRLNEAVEAHGKGGTARDWLFLAMAKQRLGRLGEARDALDKGIQWIEQMEQMKLRDEFIPVPFPWEVRLEFELLRGEAERLLKEDTPGPQK